MFRVFIASLGFWVGGQCAAQQTRVIVLRPSGLTEDIVDFRALVQIRDEEVFAKAMAHGEDLKFLDASHRPLPFEVVSWNREQHDSEIWVNVPRLRSQAATTIKLRYGGGKASENPQFRGFRAAEVWGDRYDLVLHGQQAGAPLSSAVGNSTGNPSSVNSSGEGAAGMALAFDGVQSSIELHGLQQVDRWMTPVEKIGEYIMRSPQGLANDGDHFYFASHNDPKPADIVKISRTSGKRLTTFSATGPVHSAGGDYWGTNGTVVFSTGGSRNAAGLREITLAGQPVCSWDLSGLGKGALCAWKARDRWIVLTSSGSNFRLFEVALKANGQFRILSQWDAPISLGVPQGLDYFDGHVYYYTDGGISGHRSPALITKLKLDPRSDSVQYVDQHAILIENHEAEGLTILEDGTLYVGASKPGRPSVGELYRVGAGAGNCVSTFKDFTVSAWFKQTEPGHTKYPTLIAKGSSVDNRNAFVLHTMNVGPDSLQVKFGMTAPRWFGLVSAPVSKERWHHVAGVYDHEQGAVFYLDGQLVGKRPHTKQHTVVDHGVRVTIGVDIESGRPAHHFPGLIDEVRIARFAASTSRVAATFQNISHYDDFVEIGPAQD